MTRSRIEPVAPMTIRDQDVWALLEAAEIVHAHTDGPFAARVTTALQKLFPGSVYVLDVFRDDGGHEKESDIPLDDRVAAIASEHGAGMVKRDHPMAPLLLRGEKATLRLSDFGSARRFEETELYRVIYRPADMRYQLVSPIEIPDAIGSLALSRDRLDFSDREIALLPHFARQVQIAFATERLLGSRALPAESHAELQERLARRRITRREGTVLHWMAQGKRSAEIATILGISARTVEPHLSSAYRKLGVDGRTAALAEIARTRE